MPQTASIWSLPVASRSLPRRLLMWVLGEPSVQSGVSTPMRSNRTDFASSSPTLSWHRRFGADYNDGNALKLRQDLLAGQSRQHEVEQNEIGAAVFQQKQRLRAGIGAEHRVACPLQNLLLQTPDGCVVVNNQNCLHCFQLSCFYFRSCPSPPIKAVISSMRSSGTAAGTAASWRWT